MSGAIEAPDLGDDTVLAEEIITSAQEMEGFVREMESRAPRVIEINIVNPNGQPAVAAAFEPLPKFPSQIRIKKTEYRTIARECERLSRGGDGLIANFLDMMKELNSRGFENRAKKDAKDQNMPIFNYFCGHVNSGRLDTERGMDSLFMKFVDYWWTYGMIVALFHEGTVPISVKNSKRYKMPVQVEFLDPLSVDLDELSTIGVVKYEFNEDYIKQIRLLKDKHPFVMLFPKTKKSDALPNVFTQQEIIAKAGKEKALPLPSDKTSIVRRVYSMHETYPIPYLARAFPVLDDKRILRDMDRSILTKIINLILMIKYETTPGISMGEDFSSALRTNVQTSLTSDASRMHVVIEPSTRSWEWLEVPTDSLLKQDSYRVINLEMMLSMVGLVASQIVSEAGSIDYSAIAKAIYGKNEGCLLAFRRWLEQVYEERIIIANKLRMEPSDVNVVFRKYSIFETDAFKTFITNGVRTGYLPAKIAIDEAGEDYEAAIEALIAEKALRDSEGIFIGYPQYTQIVENKTDPSNSDPDTKKTTTTNEPRGRPPGSTDTNPRVRKKNED